MKVYLELKCDPKPLSRARTSNGRFYYPQNKQDEMDTLQWCIMEAINHNEINKGLLLEWGRRSISMEVSLEFGIPMPTSYSKKKRALLQGSGHTIKPDLDNLIKNVLDRGNGILWSDDKYIYRIEATKWWAEKGYIKITIDYD